MFEVVKYRKSQVVISTPRFSFFFHFSEEKLSLAILMLQYLNTYAVAVMPQQQIQLHWKGVFSTRQNVLAGLAYFSLFAGSYFCWFILNTRSNPF